MKAATLEELKRFFESLQSDFDLRVPVLLPGDTRGLGRLDEGPLALEGGPLPRKPTEVFFPQAELLFSACYDGPLQFETAPPKPLLVVGFTAQDLACLEFIDRFFQSGYRDDVYFRKRDTTLVVGLAGRCGEGGGFLPIAGGRCDLELVSDGQRFLTAPYSAAGRALIERLDCAEHRASLQTLQTESDNLPTEEAELLAQASRLLRAGRVPESFWNDIAARCIACTGCNLACPTCTCYGVQDWSYAGRVERSRLWDSCQLDGFMREASGHNPMGTEALRTRRRIHHKLAADVERWGQISCFLCGRCDRVCPTGIGILAVAGELVRRYA